MTKTEIKNAIIEALPNKNWKLTYLSTKRSGKWGGSFTIISPITERMCNKYETYHRKINKICKAANAVYDGGGFLLSGNTYDNFFFIKKA